MKDIVYRKNILCRDLWLNWWSLKHHSILPFGSYLNQLNNFFWALDWPEYSDDLAAHESPEGAGLVAARPEDGEEEDGGDGRAEVTRYGLDVVEQSRVLDQDDTGQ